MGVHWWRDYLPSHYPDIPWYPAQTSQCEPPVVELTVRNVARKPHRCPLCDGDGRRPDKIEGCVVKCQACEGKGVLWEPR